MGMGMDGKVGSGLAYVGFYYAGHFILVLAVVLVYIHTHHHNTHRCAMPASLRKLRPSMSWMRNLQARRSESRRWPAGRREM